MIVTNRLEEMARGKREPFNFLHHYHRFRRTPTREASPEPLREPVDDHLHRVGPHHHRRRELRIVAREAVGVLNEEMVDVRYHPRSHVSVSALLERGLH